MTLTKLPGRGGERRGEMTVIETTTFKRGSHHVSTAKVRGLRVSIMLVGQK